MIIQVGMHGMLLLLFLFYEYVRINNIIILFVFFNRMNHPIKRFKSDDIDRNKMNNKNIEYDLYAGHKHTESSVLPNSFQNKPNFNTQNLKSEMGSIWKNSDEQKDANSTNFLKENKIEGDSEKSSTDLFTSEGLLPSYADLNKIFDNSDDNSNDDHVMFNTLSIIIDYNLLIFLLITL